MYRELFQIFLAVQLSAGKVPVKGHSYAELIQQRAIYADVDPLIVIAIIAHESEWHERAVSPDGEDYGLMQLRARHFGGNPQDLLVGENNIRIGTYYITLNKNLCRKFLKREPTTEEWLACYQGSCTNKKHMCKPTKLTKMFVDYAACLEEAIGRDAETDAAFECKKIYYPDPVPKVSQNSTRENK